MPLRRLILLATVAATLAACKSPAPQPITDASQIQTAQSYPDGARREQRESRHNNAAASNTPGAFDFYLLTLSWSPEFCATHANDASAAAECAHPTGFVLHGLWPQNNDGTYPEHCSDAEGPIDPYAFRAIFPDTHLLEHEWQTHGTCSGLAPDAYFQTARRALQSVTVPQQLRHTTAQLQLTPQQILSDFARANPSAPAGSFVLSCGNNYLTAIEQCLDKDLKAVSCSGVHTCRANVVKITPGS